MDPSENREINMEMGEKNNLRTSRSTSTPTTLFKPSAENRAMYLINNKNITITLISNQKMIEKVFPLLEIWDQENTKVNLQIVEAFGGLMTHSRWSLVLYMNLNVLAFNILNSVL